MKPQKSTYDTSGRRLIDRVPAGRLVIAGTIALIVLGWAVLFLLIEREKTEAIAKSALTNASLTRAFGEHVRAGLKVIDTFSWQLASEIERVGIERVKLGAHWRQLDSALPFIDQISVIGADGRIAASATAFQKLDLSKREHFRFHRDNTSARLFIATPLRYLTTGKWTVPLSRRLYARNGAFAGVLVIGLDAQYFSSYFSSISLGEKDAMAIARSDGTLLLSRNGDRLSYAETVTGFPWFVAAQSARVGWSVIQNRTDGVRLVVSYESMPDYPLVLALGTPLENAMAPVQRRLPTYFTVAAAVSAALLLAAFLIALLFQRQARANRDLAESESRFRSLTALSSDWYWEQDAQFRTTFRSDRSRQQTGATQLLELGARRWDVPAFNLTEADWARHRAQVERHEPFYDFEIERPAEHGDTGWVSLSGEPVFGPGGEFRGYRGTGRNITKRKRTEREVLRLNAELERRVSARTAELESAVQEMEAFTYSVAHDLRSPLRAMNGYCEILLQDYGSVVAEKGRGYLRRVSANSARLGNLIDDLLAFSRCSRATLSKVHVDMASLFTEVLAEQIPGDSRIRLCVGALPACVGDPSLLRQVMANLLSNAAKYGRNAAVPTIEVGHADGAYFVRDNGIGFDMQYSDKLFGVFNRLHRSDKFEGTGVGLAIVKRIVDRHGGRVWAQAEPGRGASFFFTLG